MNFPQPVPFVPYDDLEEVPNIVVDGPPNQSTLLCLSHWPVNTTPAALRRDTSTQSALDWILTPDFHVAAQAVSNSHFDEDGLFSMFAVSDPARAHAWRNRLQAASLAGDFQVADTLDATRLCAVIEALADPQVSPLPGEVFSATGSTHVALLYQHLLDLLPAILADTDAWRVYWEEDEAFLQESRQLIQMGEVRINEYPSADLAVVHMPAELDGRIARRFVATETHRVHPVAINSATQCMRILRIVDQNFELQYRYETWVQYASRKLVPRVKLHGLVDRLNQAEGNGVWVWEGAGEIAPRLTLTGQAESSIAQPQFVSWLTDWLESAEIGWDPFNWDGAPPAPIPNLVSRESAA